MGSRLEALGPSEWLYVLVVAGLLGISWLLIRRPFANLVVATCHLATANTAVLDESTSALIAAVLIVNCLVGTMIESDTRWTFRRPRPMLPILLAAVAVWAAGHGLARGNRPVWALGPDQPSSQVRHKTRSPPAQGVAPGFTGANGGPNQPGKGVVRIDVALVFG